MYDDLINIRSFSIQIKLLLRGSGLTSSKKLSVIILLIAIHDGKDETTGQVLHLGRLYCCVSQQKLLAFNYRKP